MVSYVWAAICLCAVHGLDRYLSAHWNWYEVAMLALFVLTFVFWGIASIDVRQNGQRELERKYWHKFDPTLIAEGLFSIATIMAFFKLLFICQLDYRLGPLQMSLGKMIKDVTKFLILFAIILLAFSSGNSTNFQRIIRPLFSSYFSYEILAIFVFQVWQSCINTTMVWYKSTTSQK